MLSRLHECNQSSLIRSDLQDAGDVLLPSFDNYRILEASFLLQSYEIGSCRLILTLALDTGGMKFSNGIGEIEASTHLGR